MEEYRIMGPLELAINIFVGGGREIEYLFGVALVFYIQNFTYSTYVLLPYRVVVLVYNTTCLQLLNNYCNG